MQSQYEKHKEVSTSQGVKILGKDLEKALAGLPLLVAHKEDEVPVLRVRPRTLNGGSAPVVQRPLLTGRFSLGFFLGRAGAGAETDAELHQAGGEGRLRAGVHAGIPGGSPRVPPHIQSPRKCRSGSLCTRQPVMTAG